MHVFGSFFWFAGSGFVIGWGRSSGVGQYFFKSPVLRNSCPGEGVGCLHGRVSRVVGVCGFLVPGVFQVFHLDT